MTRFVLGILLFLLSSALAQAAPPDVPKSIPAKVGELVTLEVKGKGIGYQPTFSSTDVFFARLHTDDVDTLSFVVQVKPGRNLKAPLAVVFWTVGEKAGVACVLDTGDVLPPVPPVPPLPPPVPPTPTALYFLIVRPDGPVSPAFAKVMGLPAWDTLRSGGHTVKDLERTDAQRYGFHELGLFTLDNSGPKFRIIRGPIPTPTNETDILKLPLTRNE